MSPKRTIRSAQPAERQRQLEASTGCSTSVIRSCPYRPVVTNGVLDDGFQFEGGTCDAGAPQPATQSLYFFSNLGSRRRWEKPACNYHFSPMALSSQEGLIGRSPVCMLQPQAAPTNHPRMVIAESMPRIAMSGNAIAGDRDAIHHSNREIAAFVHKSSTSSSQARFSSS